VISIEISVRSPGPSACGSHARAKSQLMIRAVGRAELRAERANSEA
jgi:hypothetical protein